LRLEDYAADPRAYMKRVLDFLGADGGSDETDAEDTLKTMVASEIANQHT